MYLVRYVKDCRRFMRDYPPDEKTNKKIYYRNVLYINSQPKYALGRFIDRIIRFYDNVSSRRSNL